METFNIIGIDPGRNIGISIYNVSLPNFKIENIFTFLYEIDKYDNNDNIDYINYNKQFNRICSIKKIVLGLLDEYKPLAVSYESAFMNTRFATAVIQLTQYTMTIDATIREYNNFIKIVNYPPKFVKQQIAGTGNADKYAMLEGVSNIFELSSLIDTKILSDHEVDALGIGYVLLKQIREQPHLLYII